MGVWDSDPDSDSAKRRRRAGDVRDLVAALRHGVSTHEAEITLKLPRDMAREIGQWIVERDHVVPRHVVQGWVRLSALGCLGSFFTTLVAVAVFLEAKGMIAEGLAFSVAVACAGMATGLLIVWVSVFNDLVRVDREWS